MRTIGLPTEFFGSIQEAPVRFNRCGAATKVGGIYLVDLHQADAASTTPHLGAGNIILPTTAGNLVGFHVIALDAVADDADLRTAQGDGLMLRAFVDATSAITKGDGLKIVNGADHMVKATAGTDRINAIAMETKGSGTGLIWVLFYSTGKATKSS